MQGLSLLYLERVKERSGMTWNAKIPEGMTLEERNYRIFDKVFNGESPTDVAKEFGISQPRVTQIYKKLWKENCSMPSGEKIVRTVGKDRLIKIGHEQYEGYYTKKNGKVVKKRFEGPDAEKKWLYWRDSWLDVIGENLVSKNAVKLETNIASSIAPLPESPQKTSSSETYILRTTTGEGKPVLFKDLDKAIYISDMITYVTGTPTEVVEYIPPKFWEGEE